MSYSIDLRQRVVSFVQKGGSKAEAARRFQVSLWCVFNWMKRKDLQPSPALRRVRKLDWQALKAHVHAYPDALLRERAAHFKVHINAIWYALCQMKISYKKKPQVWREKSLFVHGLSSEDRPPVLDQREVQNCLC